MPGGTNLPVLRGLGCGSQTPYPYDAYPPRIEGLADKVSSRLGGSWHWQGKEAVCEARGAEARVAYDDTSISIDVSLPLVLRPLRGKLESKIEEYYERYFGCD
ncbi:MAG: hypothetical protein CL933_01895 [Deltaproteobacteria bacterium]|nr:hypothetical protein [Deltaproteobacteria bacterium]